MLFYEYLHAYMQKRVDAFSFISVLRVFSCSAARGEASIRIMELADRPNDASASPISSLCVRMRT